MVDNARCASFLLLLNHFILFISTISFCKKVYNANRSNLQNVLKELTKRFGEKKHIAPN